jgi:hypothetical protein
MASIQYVRKYVAYPSDEVQRNEIVEDAPPVLREVRRNAVGDVTSFLPGAFLVLFLLCVLHCFLWEEFNNRMQGIMNE